MSTVDSKTHLLQFVTLSCLLFFVAVVYTSSVVFQQKIISATITSTAKGVTYAEYYPGWFFRVLALLQVVVIASWTVALARILGKSYPTLDQFVSRKVSLILVFLLNILFLGTSHALSYPPFPFYQTYNAIIAALCAFSGLGLQSFYDFASSLLLAATIASASLRYRDLGLEGGLRKVAQVVSLALMPLGVEIFVFDNSEWNLHVTQFQATYNMLPWFTNADLFFVTITLFLTATLSGWHNILLNATRSRIGSRKRNELEE